MHRAVYIFVILLLAAVLAPAAAAVTLDSAFARPADTFLTFPAFYSGWDSDDSAQCLGASHALHPALAFSNRGFLGYRFWVAYTPLCISESDENPHLAVSNDGRTWREFTNTHGTLANPIFDRSLFRAIHLSDPDLLLVADSVLYLLFRATWEIAGIDSNAVYISATTDGLTWTPPIKILSDGLLNLSTRSAFLSPALIADTGSHFLLYVVEPRCDGITLLDTSRVVAYRAPHPFGPWTPDDTCRFLLPSDSLKIWHLDILTDPLDRRTALLNLVPNTPQNGGDSGMLFLADYSAAADLWTVAPSPVLSWQTDPSAWYGRRIYRASGVWLTTPDDTLIWLYYSAYAHRLNAGGTGTGWQTGLTWITFDSTPSPLCLAPTLRGEPNLSHVVNPHPTFQWLSADPASHQPQSETALELFHDEPGDSSLLWSGTVLGDTTLHSPASLTLEPGTHFTLRLRTRHSDTWSPWTTLPFRTNAAPAVPICLSPPHDPTHPLYDLQPVFTWTPSADPDTGDLVRYRFELTEATALTNDTSLFTVDSLTTAATSVVPPDSLSIATPYTWRVTACDTFGACSPGSDSTAFVTFRPGDLTADLTLSIADLTRYIAILFRGGILTIPPIGAETDTNCGLTVADLTVLIAHLFRGAPPPAPGCD